MAWHLVKCRDNFTVALTLLLYAMWAVSEPSPPGNEINRKNRLIYIYCGKIYERCWYL